MLPASLPGRLVPLSLAFLLVACDCGSVEPEGEVGVPSASVSTITVDPSTLPADGETTAVVTVTVLDFEGTPVAGVEVVLATSRDDDDVLVQPGAVTDEDGVATGTLSSAVPGTTEVTAQAGEVSLEAAVDVVFEAEETCPDETVDCGDDGCQALGTLDHCSACGDACEAPASAVASCDGGSCSWTCDDGYANCDGNDETGCETELETGETTCPDCTGGTVACNDTCVSLGTLEHCTDCDDGCSAPDDAWAACTDDGCVWDCNEGFGACDDENACQPLGTLAHCTECEDACTAPDNASASCTGDGCTWDCDIGYDTCEDDDSCVALGTVAHCDACDSACTAPENAIATCTEGACGFECEAGWGNCDEDPATCDGQVDGTGACVDVVCPGDEVYCPDYGCVDLGTVDHCESCGDACSDVNATPTCGTGGCELVCDEGFADCNQDASDGCEVDLTESSCCEDESVMVVTDTCLTAEAGGRLAAVVYLVDGVGAPVSGASVSIEGGDLVALGSVTESTAVPGAYVLEFEAPSATGVFDVTATAEAGACGSSVAFDPVAVTVVSPTVHAFGGTGGCSPRGGNLRVRIVDETGIPMEDAFVMVGQAAGDVLHDDVETWLGQTAPSGANTATTPADGYVVFQDYGDVLRDAEVLVTAGADGYAYASWTGFDAGDLVIALEPLAEIPERVEISGEVTGYRNASGLRLALVTQALDIGALSSFQLNDILEDDKPVEVTGASWCDANFDIPGNIHFPTQTHVLCTLTASPPDYLLSPVRGPSIDAAALQGDMDPGAALDATGSLAELLAIMRFRAVGLLENVETDESAGGEDIPISSTLDETMPIQASNAPQGDLYLLSIGDLDGLNGLGRLYLQGIKIGEDVTAHTDTLTTSRDEGDFTGVRHLAMAISLVEGEGASAILERSTTGRTDTRAMNDFFETPGASVNDRSFSWQDVSVTTSPADYHVSRSILRRMTPAGDYRQEAEPFWHVYAPAGVRSFTLPVLPPTAPRANDGGYLLPAGDQQNRWFLGLYYQGLLANPADFDPADWASGSIEPHLTHISLSEATLP